MSDPLDSFLTEMSRLDAANQGQDFVQLCDCVALISANIAKWTDVHSAGIARRAAAYRITSYGPVGNSSCYMVMRILFDFRVIVGFEDEHQFSSAVALVMYECLEGDDISAALDFVMFSLAVARNMYASGGAMQYVETEISRYRNVILSRRK